MHEIRVLAVVALAVVFAIAAGIAVSGGVMEAEIIAGEWLPFFAHVSGAVIAFGVFVLIVICSIILFRD